MFIGSDGAYGIDEEDEERDDDGNQRREERSESGKCRSDSCIGYRGH
jgi:hypothetical protein